MRHPAPTGSRRPRPCPAFAGPLPRRPPAMITVGLSTLGFCSLGMLAAMFSALAFYAASPHCRWPRLRAPVASAARSAWSPRLPHCGCGWPNSASLPVWWRCCAPGCSPRCCCRRWPPGIARARSRRDVVARHRRHHRWLPACGRRDRPAGLATARPVAARTGADPDRLHPVMDAGRPVGVQLPQRTARLAGSGWQRRGRLRRARAAAWPARCNESSP